MPNATTSCTSTHAILEADLDAGSIVNTATASTIYNGQPVTSNQATATVTAQSITVDKVTIPPGASQLFSFVTAGGTISDSFQLADATPPRTTWVTPGSYKVTETVPTGWVQTATCVGGPFGAGAAYTNGGSFTVSPGDQITCTFTNRRAMTPASFCSKSEPQTVLNPTSGRFKNNKGFDVVVRTDLVESIQSVLDTVVDYNGDGYIIVGIVNNGSGKLGGNVYQNVKIDRTYDKPFGLIACSVTLHDPIPGDDKATGHVALTASAPEPTVGAGNIFIMDLHGADSKVAGWKIDGNGRYLRNVNALNNATGVWFLGDNNTMQRRGEQ